MKFYLHLGEVCIIVNCGENTTVSELTKIFLDRLEERAKKTGITFNPQLQNNTTLFTDSSFSGSSLPQSSKVSQLLKDKQDIFARFTEQQQQPQSPQKALLEVGKKLLSVGRTKEAKTAFERVLATNPDDPEALLHLSGIFFSAGNLNKAEPLIRKGVKMFPQRIDFHILLGDLLYQREDYSSSATSFANGLSILNACISGSTASSEIQMLSDTIFSKLGLALFYSGDDKKAMECFSSVLVKNKEHIPSLLGYAKVLSKRSKLHPNGDDPSLTEEALQVRLHLLVMNQKSIEAREDISDSLISTAGIRALKKILNCSTDSSAAFAFIATVLKESSVFEQSIELYDIAIQDQPSSASYALNVSHVCECLGWLNKAMEFIWVFLDKNPNLSVCNVSCKQIAAIISPLIECIRKEDPKNRPITNLNVIPGIPQNVISTTSNNEFSENELNLIALFYSIVKLCFVTGFLQFLNPLIEISKRFRDGHDLHLTTIRNEQAYFACIEKLSEKLTISSIDFSLPTIYVLGDSHTLSCGWQIVELSNGMKYILKPYLVTGLKIWHLRSKSNFYPKRNFWQTVNQIPRGSIVITLLGEIDCREGLLSAIDKCKYDTITEGSLETISIYKEILTKLQKDFQFKIFVHPPVPVLNETRSIIHTFTSVLKQEINGISSPTLQFLDISEQLVTPNWESLKQEFNLDGTHLNSQYVQKVLQPVLSSLLI